MNKIPRWKLQTKKNEKTVIEEEKTIQVQIKKIKENMSNVNNPLIILKGNDFKNCAYPFKLLSQVHFVNYKKRESQKYFEKMLKDMDLVNIGIQKAKTTTFVFNSNDKKEPKEVDISSLQNVGELSIKLAEKFGVKHVAIFEEGNLLLDPKKNT